MSVSESVVIVEDVVRGGVLIDFTVLKYVFKISSTMGSILEEMGWLSDAQHDVWRAQRHSTRMLIGLYCLY